MHLVQILLPVYDNRGDAVSASLFSAVRVELTQRFGGVTAYQRAPAAGLWKNDTGQIDRDDVVMVEVMVESLDRAWWNSYRARLESQFRQQTIVVRASAIERL